MIAARTLADVEADLTATADAFNEASKRAGQARVAARKSLDAGSKDGFVTGCNRVATFEAEAAELLELCHRFGDELRSLESRRPFTPDTDDPFAGLS